MNFELPEYNIAMMLPEIFLFGWVLVVMTADLLGKRKADSLLGYLTMAGLLITGILVWLTGYGRGFGNMFFVDPSAVFFKMIFLGAAFMAVGMSFGVMKEKIKEHRGEFFGLIMLSTIGMMFLASSHELLSLYIGLELATIPVFVLAAFYKDNKMSVEAGTKYFIIGALSSALLLFGISFIYGMAGTTDIVQMKVNLALTHLRFESIGLVPMIGITLMVAGIGFKLALPPFHQWAPDVYEGSPTPITAFLSVASKAAGLIAFAKIFVNGMFAFYGTEMRPSDWGQLVGIMAIAAMVIGNSAAIWQSNIKRMLAYSSIAQAGYMMIGMIAFNELGLASMSYYMFVYMFANMGIFAIVAAVEHKSGSCQITDYRGLSKTSPGLAMGMTIFLLSLAGIPPLAGFLAKYYVFAAAIKAANAGMFSGWIYWVVGAGLLTSVFSLYYYANIIKQMYFVKDEAPFKITLDIPTKAVLTICIAGVFFFGLYPEPIMNFATDISASFGFISTP